MIRLFTLVLLIFLSACEAVESSRSLPYIGHYDLEYSIKDGLQVIDTVYQPVQSFTYQNQDGLQVTNKNYANKVWITEFFFSTCPTICPIMTVQMTKLFEEVNTMDKKDQVQFLSFSIDPEKDTPETLKRYKNLYCKNCENWDFLTGDEKFTHRLGIESFKIFAGREEQAEGGFAHSGAFSLVDTKGFLRGVYNITGFDGSVNNLEYYRLLEDLKVLLTTKIDTH